MSDYDLIQFLRDKVAKRGKNEKMYRQLLEMACGDESEPPEPELKPCTMCGSTKLVSVLYCHHCSSESGWFEDKQQAIDTCNRTGQEAFSSQEVEIIKTALVYLKSDVAYTHWGILIQFLRDKVAKRGKNEKMYRQLLEMATGDESEPPEPEGHENFGN